MTMYEVTHYWVRQDGEGMETRKRAYFTSKDKAIDLCRDWAKDMPILIEVRPNYDIVFGIRIWNESEGRLYNDRNFVFYETYMGGKRYGWADYPTKDFFKSYGYII